MVLFFINHCFLVVVVVSPAFLSLSDILGYAYFWLLTFIQFLFLF